MKIDNIYESYSLNKKLNNILISNLIFQSYKFKKVFIF